MPTCAQTVLPFTVISILPPVYYPLPPLENSRGSAVSLFPQIWSGVGEVVSIGARALSWAAARARLGFLAAVHSVCVYIYIYINK